MIKVLFTKFWNLALFRNKQQIIIVLFKILSDIIGSCQGQVSKRARLVMVRSAWATFTRLCKKNFAKLSVVFRQCFN